MAIERNRALDAHALLFLFCALVAILGPVRGLDVECDSDISDYISCVISEPVTAKTGQKLNIISKTNLNSINELKFMVQAQMSTVPSEIFDQLPNLEILNLYATAEVLNKDDFEKAGKLSVLTIKDQLKIIPAGVLGSAKNLVSLDLSDNKITEIEDNAFSGLNELIYFHLERNKLPIIKQNTFSGLEKLEILYLQSNQIESIEENALNLPNLSLFSVSDNKLTSLSDNLFAATPLLKHFDAERNQITHLGKSLYGLKDLRYLYLSYNKPTDMDFVAILQLPKLDTLILDETGLTSENISRIDIKEPTKSVLSILSIGGNQLANNEDWKKFAIFSQLATINVGNTKYSKIDVGDKTLRQQFPKLTRVFVVSGEWSCDWLKNFIESSKEDGIDVKTSGLSGTSNKEVNGIGCV